MTVTDWVFIFVAAATLLGAYRVVVSQRMMHAALWLGFTFLGVAGIFLLLGADFLAAAQVLIYVGAITTILIFGIMLSAVDDLRGGSGQTFWQKVKLQFASPRKGLLPLLAAGGFAAVMLVLFNGTVWPDLVEQGSLDTVRRIGATLFREYVIPFEVASVVLLAALVGAIAVAMREEKSE